MSFFQLSEERLASMLVGNKKAKLKRDYLLAVTLEEGPDFFNTYIPLQIISGEFCPFNFFRFLGEPPVKYRKIHIIPLKKELTEEDMVHKDRVFGLFTTAQIETTVIKWTTDNLGKKKLFTLAERIKKEQGIEQKVLFYPAVDSKYWSHLRIGFVLLKAALIVEREEMLKILKSLGFANDF